MGSSTSSEQVDEKVVESNGQVNNNVIIQEAKDTHNQLLVNEKLLYATYALIVFEIIKLAIYLLSAYRRKMKKAFASKNNKGGA